MLLKSLIQDKKKTILQDKKSNIQSNSELTAVVTPVKYRKHCVACSRFCSAENKLLTIPEVTESLKTYKSDERFK